MGNTSLTSLSLLGRVKANDPEAWEKFSYLYRPMAVEWCRHFGLDEATAEDLTQEIFLGLTRDLAQFEKRRPGDGFRKWFRTIVANRLRSWYREGQRLPVHHHGSAIMQMLREFPEQEPSATMEGECSDDALLQRGLELVKAEFETRTWQAFWRYHVEQASTSEIARELGMTANSARKARWRVLHRLRREFEGLLTLGPAE